MAEAGGPRHTGAHKINNAVGQTLLAKRLGARRIIAETGAGQHGVASAAAAARLSLPCVVYMGAVDVERQAPNVGRMQLLGATVVPVESGDKTLRAAIDEALRDWVSDPDGTYYSIGSAVGPHPYPYLVRELQSVIGREARSQMLEQAGGLPDVVVACVGGGSNAIGLFHPFLDDAAVTLLGIEAGGRGPGLGDNAASLTAGTPGVLQGSYTLILQDAHGQVRETHSVSAGLDYSGVGPEHAYLMKNGRVAYESAMDEEALDALAECARYEGILPAIESAHAFLRRPALRPRPPGCTHPHRLLGPRRQGHAHPATHFVEGSSGHGRRLSMAPRDTISAAIQSAAMQGRPALVGFLTAGFPSRREFKKNLAAVAGACDVVEIGVPFSDPMADGTTVQRASFAALADGVTLPWILEELQSLPQRVPRAPVADELFESLAELWDRRAAPRGGGAGVSGFIVPDLPFEESHDLQAALDREGLALIQMVTPVTPEERLKMLCREARGFVYAVTMTGTTGKTAEVPAEVLEYMDRVKRYSSAPVCAGLRHPVQGSGRSLRETRRWRGGGVRPGRNAGAGRGCAGLPGLAALRKISP